MIIVALSKVSSQVFFLMFFFPNQAQKFQQGLEEAKKENQQNKEKFLEVKNQLTQNQNQLTQVPWHIQYRCYEYNVV